MKRNGMRVEAWLVIVILPLMVIGCQLGSEHPKERITAGHEPHTKIVDG